MRRDDVHRGLMGTRKAGSPLWRRLFERAGVVRIPTGPHGQLIELGRGTPELLSYEGTYGGHAIEDGWTFGVLSCAHLPAVDGLVPVATHEDVVAYLDAHGAGWIQDTIEESAPRRIAANAEALVIGILLWDRHHRSRGARRFEGAHGEALADQLSLTPIVEVTSKAERWWGDEHTWVVQRGTATMVGGDDASRLVALEVVVKNAKKSKATSQRATPAAAKLTKAVALPRVTSPTDVRLEVGRDDLDLGQFMPSPPAKVLALLAGAFPLNLGGRVEASAPDGVTIVVPPSVTVVVKIATMGKGTALRATVRGHAPSDADAWLDRLEAALR